MYFVLRSPNTKFNTIDVGLGTASVNVVVGLNLMSGLLGGFLADRVLGKCIYVYTTRKDFTTCGKDNNYS